MVFGFSSFRVCLEHSRWFSGFRVFEFVWNAADGFRLRMVDWLSAGCKSGLRSHFVLTEKAVSCTDRQGERSRMGGRFSLFLTTGLIGDQHREMFLTENQRGKGKEERLFPDGGKILSLIDVKYLPERKPRTGERMVAFEMDSLGSSLSSSLLSFRKEERERRVIDLEMDGRRVSSLSVGSNESEGSGGTRVGEISPEISI